MDEWDKSNQPGNPILSFWVWIMINVDITIQSEVCSNNCVRATLRGSAFKSRKKRADNRAFKLNKCFQWGYNCYPCLRNMSETFSKDWRPHYVTFQKIIRGNNFKRRTTRAFNLLLLYFFNEDIASHPSSFVFLNISIINRLMQAPGESFWIMPSAFKIVSKTTQKSYTYDVLFCYYLVLSPASKMWLSAWKA